MFCTILAFIGACVHAIAATAGKYILPEYTNNGPFGCLRVLHCGILPQTGI
jgi:hypothetical protein